MLKKSLYIAAVALGLNFNSPIVLAASKAPPITGCKKTVAFITYRSDLLRQYKITHDKKAKTVHHLWDTRIKYAKQWVPDDALKAQDSLDQYDRLQAITSKELDGQIKAYDAQKKSKLDCSPAKKALLNKKIAEIEGTSTSRGDSSNDKIRKKTSQENDYLKSDFKKNTEKLMIDLHKAKLKDPKAYPKI